MHLTKSTIQALDKYKRINIINSITGIKPANLIGTQSKEHGANLAIFSSVIHLGSNPPLIGFVTRPVDDVPRHTYQNIGRNACYTINHVHQSFMEQAHYTSAKFETGVSEFEKCKLTPEYLFGFEAPFVKESLVKIALRLKEEIAIKSNGTILMIGEIEHLILPDTMVNEKGDCDLSLIEDIGISGLDTYYALQKIATFPYARPTTLPEF